jgi:sporulation protein YlmC with PRC-barrel domain
MRISDEALRGRTVIGADGHAIGEVTRLFMETHGWQVEALEVRLRKPIAEQLGATHSFFRAGSLEIPVNLIQSVGDAVVLSVRVDGLRAVLPAADEAAPAH